MSRPRTRHNVTADYDAVIVGGGFSGLYALYRLRGLGLRVRLFERGSGVGGTWFWNRYPGLQCDTESLSYSFTFSPQLYRGWTWTSRFAPQQEILDYANYVTDRLDLLRDITFNTDVESAHYDDLTNQWVVGLGDGSEVTCTYFVTAVGPLSAANVPRLEGLDTFRGQVLHTGQWPQDGSADLTGKRVAVIGTGSSGVQVITALAGRVDQLVVFQRTPQYVMPTRQRPLAAQEIHSSKENLAGLVEQKLSSAFGAPGASTHRSVFDDGPNERMRVLDEGWNLGAQAFPLATYNDFLTNEEANRVASDFVRRKIADIVEDPMTAQSLMPDYYFGTKRPVQADGYYETYNRDDVHLVDTRVEAIETMTPAGIRTSAAEYGLDAIILATGFDAITGPLFSMDIQGRHGVTLREKWADGARVASYLGVATNGFPNMFMVQGPQSLSVMANFLCGIEVNVDWITGLLRRALASDAVQVEATADAETRWAQHCQDLVEKTLILKTPSWWTGANIEGKARSEFFTTYPGGVAEYAKALGRAEDNDYEGFLIRPARTAPSGDQQTALGAPAPVSA